MWQFLSFVAMASVMVFGDGFCYLYISKRWIYGENGVLLKNNGENSCQNLKDFVSLHCECLTAGRRAV